mmetsp:Transcript_561/g.557  ORF Transcript_561/g.557 Transcript_561/m.557 type:complete len:85 (-) Transcript_561:54-308(-)
MRCACPIFVSVTKGVFFYCTEMFAKYHFLSDSMCTSNICVTPNKDGSGLLNGNTRIYIEGTQAMNQARNTNFPCQNNICSLQST